MANLSVLSVNIRGLNHVIKRKRFFPHLHTHKPDICMLQETHIKKKAEIYLRSRKYSQQWHAAGSSKARGVSLLLKRELNFQMHGVHTDPQGRFLFVKGTLDSSIIMFAVIYMPNDGQITFLRQTFMLLRAFAEGPTIVGGDFNYVVNLARDRTHYRTNRNKQPPITSLNTPLYALLEEFMLVDIWRQEHPQERDFTHFSARHNIYTHIDYVLISKPHTDMVVSAHIGPKVLTDHTWLDFIFKRSTDFKRSPSWSLNKSLLHSDGFCSEITKET